MQKATRQQSVCVRQDSSQYVCDKTAVSMCATRQQSVCVRQDISQYVCDKTAVSKCMDLDQSTHLEPLTHLGWVNLVVPGGWDPSTSQ
jgi:hypothetical protein